jgi:superoxide dismutase, Cu-Zn family
MRAVSVAALAATAVAVFGGGVAAANPVHTAVTFGVTPGAYSYDSTYVPAGARAQVQSVETGNGRTIISLQVFGLLPDRDYGAHAHKFGCGPLATDAGGHFQYVPGGATDPAFANPQNEIWLDLHTDAEGDGASMTIVDWQFPADRRAQSVVLHDHHTATESGTAGTAGPRYACLTVAF